MLIDTAPVPAIPRRTRRLAQDCAALLREHGEDAALAARSRALASLARDNAVAYLHWRAVEALSVAAVAPREAASLH